MGHLNFHLKSVDTVLKVFVLFHKHGSTQNLGLLLEVNELDFHAGFELYNSFHNISKVYFRIETLHNILILNHHAPWIVCVFCDWTE